MKAKVFVGSSTAALQIAEYAQAELVHVSDPEVWTNGNFAPNFTPIESLFFALDRFQFALFIAHPEDLTTKRGKGLPTIRDNVLFESGLFLGRLGRERVYMIAPKDNEEVFLSLPTDLTGITPSHYDVMSGNLQASVGTALHHMKQALRNFDAGGIRILFDSRQNMKLQDLVVKEGQRWNNLNQPASSFATGDYVVDNEALEIQRSNCEGIYEIEIRPNGPGEPTVSKLPKSERLFDIRFEARVENTCHKVRALLLDAKKYWWLDQKEFKIASYDWRPYAAVLRAAPNADILARIDEECDETPSGKLYIRNIKLGEYFS